MATFSIFERRHKELLRDNIGFVSWRDLEWQTVRQADQ